MKLSVYCGRAFTGFPVPEIIDYYEKLSYYFCDTSIRIIAPISIMHLGKDFEFEKNITPNKDINNKTVTKRDFFLIDSCEIVYIYLKGTDVVSIGAICELTYAYSKRKHTVVCVEKGNTHYHGFIETMSDYISDNHDDCLDYILQFGGV